MPGATACRQSCRGWGSSRTSRWVGIWVRRKTMCGKAGARGGPEEAPTPRAPEGWVPESPGQPGQAPRRAQRPLWVMRRATLALEGAWGVGTSPGSGEAAAATSNVRNARLYARTSSELLTREEARGPPGGQHGALPSPADSRSGAGGWLNLQNQPSDSTQWGGIPWRAVGTPCP